MFKNSINSKFVSVFVLLFIGLHAKADILFIGHGYGNHGGNIIPYPPLEAFISQNNLPDTRVWGGDLTEQSLRFLEFQQYLMKIGGVNLLVRGNHDGNLYTKTPFWSDYVTHDNVWIHNFDMEADMKFDFLPVRPTVIASHYVWFNQIFSPLNFPNWMKGAQLTDLNKIQFNGDSHLYIAGDCGAFAQHAGGFARTFIGNNQFVCSGMGGGAGVDNAVLIKGKWKVTPVFFANDGSIIPHVCKSIKSNSGFGNKIDVCGSAEYMNQKYR